MSGVKFCIECGNTLTPSTETGELIFHCICEQKYPADPSSSLRYQEYLTAAESSEKYNTFIENSPHDTAGRKVKKICPSCNLDYMTMIYVGKNQTALYVCDCGERITTQVKKIINKIT